MSARDRILDTFEAILSTEGERGATLDAVAAGAAVSKGGLLYHFRNREALVDGLLDRLLAHAEVDVAAMTAAPEGPSWYYLTSCAVTGTPFDRTLIAVSRLGLDNHPRAGATIRGIQERWLDLVVSEVGDAAIARAIILMGDGLYLNAVFATSPAQEPADLDALVRVLELLKRGASAGL